MRHDLQTRLPSIAISGRDIDRLRHLAEAAIEKYPATAEFLAREIDRAEIIPADRPARNIVTMQSEVTFVDNISGQQRTVILVYPEDADVDACKNHSHRRGPYRPVRRTEHRVSNAIWRMAIHDGDRGRVVLAGIADSQIVAAT